MTSNVHDLSEARREGRSVAAATATHGRLPDQHQQSGMFASLAHRDFRYLWIGNLGSSFAMNMQIIARGWLVYALTESTLNLAWVTLSFTVPQVLFSLYGGVLADRLPKKWVVAAAQTLNAVATLIMALIIYHGHVDLWDFIWFGIFNGSVLALSMPARQSVIPELVGERLLFNAIALNTASWNLSRIVGPAVAGALIALLAAGDKTSSFGVGVVYFLIAGLYLVSAISASLLRWRGEPNARERQHALREIGDALAYVWRAREVLGLLALAVIPMLFGMTMNSLMPAFNQDILHGGPDDLGIISMAMGIGAIAGSLLMARMGEMGRKGMWQFTMCFFWGVLLILFADTTALTTACVMAAAVGFAMSIFMSMNRSLVQLRVDPEMRGRVMSVDMMSRGLMPLGIMPISLIAEYYDISIALMVSGACLALLTLVCAAIMPAVRRIDRGYDDEDVEAMGDAAPEAAIA